MDSMGLNIFVVEGQPEHPLPIAIDSDPSIAMSQGVAVTCKLEKVIQRQLRLLA